MDLHELSELLALPSLVSDLDALEAAMVDVLREADTLDALVEPGIRVVTGGGKRLRPTLTIAAAAVGGAPANDHVTAAGVAVELVQVGSLVHDDLMDQLNARHALCDLILRLPNERKPLFPLHFPMNCATVVGQIVGVRAFTPRGLRRKLLANGAEVIHENPERRSTGQGGPAEGAPSLRT